MKRWLAVITIFILLVASVGCSKTTEQQIAEQLELGQKYLLELNYEEAVAAFRKVIDLEPKHMGAYLGLADAYLGMDDDAEALVVLETASQIISDSYDEKDSLFASAEEVLERLAAMYIERGEQDKADGVAQLAERFGIDVEFAEEDAALAAQEPETDEGSSEEEESEESVSVEESQEEESQEEESQEDDSGYTEEELEEFTAGYRAAMRYPEGRREKAEPIDIDAFYSIPSLYWFIDIGDIDRVSEIIDHSDYYEITNCWIRYPYVIPDEIFEQFEDGFEFDLSLYDQNGSASTVHYAVIYRDGDWVLSDDEGYIEVGDDGKKFVMSYYGGNWLGIIYRGSLFFRKDCIVHDTRFAETETFEEYVTNEHPGFYRETWFEGGGDGNSLSFHGEVIFDPDTGMIVECQEIYQP